jgi:hypothetical protein
MIETCSPDETKWNPGMRYYYFPDYAALHPGYNTLITGKLNE